MTIYISIILFIFGIIMGSFYNVLATRLPQNRSIIRPGSHCDFCQEQLKWYENIPLLSYILQKGKCRHCKKVIPFNIFVSELATGILFVFSYLYFGVSYEFFIMMILSSLTVIIFISDFKFMIILDSPLVISIILVFILKIIYFDFNAAILSLVDGLIAFLVMLLVAFIGKKIYKRDALGGGDIKLSFVIGMILGIQLSMVALIFSTFLALPYALATIVLKKDSEVPFGPFIASSLFLVFLYYDKFYNIVKLFYIF
ncbi:MAG: prepilin peptidase [Bacilli bacterium]|nr:prepilin peptidase [Bacilli bacterium]